MNKIFTIEEFDNVMKLDGSEEQYKSLVDDVLKDYPKEIINNPKLHSQIMSDLQYSLDIILYTLIVIRYGIEDESIKEEYNEEIDKYTELARERFETEISEYQLVLDKINPIKK